jgi:hypothetical protein
MEDGRFERDYAPDHPIPALAILICSTPILMAFDFNEARAIIEQAKQQGLIRNADSPDPKPKASNPDAGGEDLPDWLKKGIREPKAEN